MRASARGCLLLVMAFWAIGAHAQTQAGFDAYYRAAIGDINADGKKDIYLKYVPTAFTHLPVHRIITPIPMTSRGVGQFVLLNNGSGFTIMSLTPANIANVMNWPLTSLEVAAGDYNADGTTDGLIVDLKTHPNFLSMKDPVVLASNVVHGLPSQVVMLGPTVEEMVAEVRNWYVDNSYFDSQQTQNFSQWYYVGKANDLPSLAVGFAQCEANPAFDYCVWFYTDLDVLFSSFFGLDCTAYFLGIGENPATFCTLGYHVFGIDETQQTVTVQDFSGVLQVVIDIVTTTQNAAIGTASIEDVVEIFESFLGWAIGGLDISAVAAHDERYQGEVAQKSAELIRVLIELRRAYNVDERATSDIVYVTGHRTIFGIGPWHLAIAYRPPIAPTATQTLSAGPQGLPSKLVKERQRVTDIHNPLLGVLTSSTYPVPRALWDALVLRFTNYDNGLNYDFFPNPMLGSYNSNGFVAGLANRVNGVTNYDIGSTVGGSIPVPNSEFD